MQVTIKGQLVAHHYDFMEPGALAWSFSQYSNAKVEGECVAVVPHVIEFEAPDLNIIAAQTQALEASKAAALAEYQQKVAHINERLSKLQAITNEVAA